ncbi:MAG: sulfatase-like hydrolase/transferase [Arcobacter sp.]|nr:sulfatase-like hydrolase/transferase [Arcobacter sp.]
MKRYLNVYWKTCFALLAYPIILAFILEISIQGIGYSVFQNLIENILFAVLIFLAINQLSGIKFGKKIANILIIFFYLILIIETGLFLLFQTRFNASYIYVILNTNYNEVKEFSSVYYNYNLFWLLLFLVPLLSVFSKKIYKQVKANTINLIGSLILIVFVLSVLKFSELIIYNLPYIAVKSYGQYQDQVNSINTFKDQEEYFDTKLVTENETIVVVIGESATSKHMGIYGYHRETTPRFSKLSDSLIVYNDVISSHAYTTGSIYDIFTLSNYENPKKSTPLISFIKNAGYKVFWLSSQRPIGFHDNLVSRLASAADESLFLNYNDYLNKTPYDEVLLPKLKEKLTIEGKKVIFVNITGNHYAYEKRYPKEFDKFSSDNNTKKSKIIDTYDNAILYTDFVVSEMIKTVQQEELKSALIYFSDHGEEVYDTSDFFGHFEDKPTSTMYEVPFLVYMSPSFERPLDFTIDESRAYMLDDFPHSLTHFMGIESDLLKKERSIFSDKFKARKRIIQDSLDFNTFKLLNKK